MGTVSSVAAHARTLIVVALAVVLTVGSVVWGAMPRALADVNDFEFESLDVVYELGRAEDGTSTLTVTETFVAVFPEFDQNRGMQRRIPDSYLGAPLHPRLVSITDGEGNSREEEAESDDDYYIMTSRAGDFVHGRQTYVFTYTLENVVRHFEDTGVDEFFWNVNGTEWQQPFGQVTARVTMAPDVADGLTGAQACYVGYEGSTVRCAIASGGAAVEASAGPVLAYQTMTLAIGFDPATFEEFDASYLASPWGWLQLLSALGMVGALAWALIVRRRHLRDDPGRPVIIAEYTPPRMVDALEGAVMLGLTTKAIPAEVLEQAVAGSLRIVEGERKFWGGAKLKAQLVDPSKADGDGRMLLEGLFPNGVPGEEFEFGRTDTRFSSAAQSILKAANQELVNRRLRREVPVLVRVWPFLAAIGAAVLIFVTGFAALDGMVNPLVPILLIVGAVPATIVVGGLVARKPLTALGAETRDHLLGLKEFIEWAEADRIRMLQSPQGAERVQIDTTDRRMVLRLYEALLPYAVVFGQEKDWARELAVLYGPGASPVWYAGSGGFDASSFSAGISTLSASTASSSSTSGGSSGGGSAGGGGGGGGGGGV
ncbi:DUF2207 domain-containing protein [Microbacterium sp. Root180]|uniref:DUF2207 domain-containing protein n=1 Tax=Microbacterium sp. Root180 TaxID=1736483 RepID=UPI0006F39D06|nr:DUF2207 domain-containing protein [Microbacterium sp. Root180]KRB36511.1 hypothetical protein ASD93_10625 [Microbacterium sp. Root180]